MGNQNESCWWCVKAVKWIPVIFILTIVGWSYYAYVVQLCYYTITSSVQHVFYLLFFHILLFMFLWSYWQTVFSELTPIPDMFKVPDSEVEKLLHAPTEEAVAAILERLAQNLPVTNRTIRGAIRFCDKCQLMKPDRTHHCSVCRTCVLKMDHHCPWVNNCVAYHNYKYFMLFLMYALLYCVFIAATSLQYFIYFWKVDHDGMAKFHILFLLFVAVIFAVSLNLLFFYHCYLILHNRSTLEAFRPPIFHMGKDKDGFSIGKYNNFQEVFGDNRSLWCLPIFTSLGNGVVYPVRPQHQGGPNTHNFIGSNQNRCNLDSMTLVEEATILALGAGTAVIGPTIDANEPLVNRVETV